MVTQSGPDSGGRAAASGQPGDPMEFGGFGGRGGMEGLGGGMFPSDSLRYGAIWFPTVPVRGQATNFQMVGAGPLLHPPACGPIRRTRWSISGGVRNRLIETDAILPDTGQPFPSDLWNVHLGLRYARQLETAGWRAAA